MQMPQAGAEPRLQQLLKQDCIWVLALHLVFENWNQNKRANEVISLSTPEAFKTTASLYK